MTSLLTNQKPLILFDPFGISDEYLDWAFDKYPNGLFWILKRHFENLGFEVHTTDYPEYQRAEWIVFFGFPQKNPFFIRFLESNIKLKMALFLFEPPVVEPVAYVRANHDYFTKIFTYISDLPDQRKYFKYLFPQMAFEKKLSIGPTFSEKKFLVMMNGNKSVHPQFNMLQRQTSNDLFHGITELYTARRNFIHYCERFLPNDFDLFGPGWSKKTKRWTNVFRSNRLRTYRGTADDKVKTLSKYKFVICYENATGLPGYITEKIFDCFRAQSIPIYWGAPDIDKYIPSTCYIDRRIFSSDDDMVSFLKTMTESDYLSYIQAIQSFLKSAEIRNWSIQILAENLSDNLTG